MIRAPFTNLQGQYLAFMAAYTAVNDRPPAEADMQHYFRVTPPSVHSMIVTLERRGLILRTPGRARSIEVLVPHDELPELVHVGRAGLDLRSSRAQVAPTIRARGSPHPTRARPARPR